MLISAVNSVAMSTLLRMGADLNLRRPGGWSPLMLAIYRGDIEVVRVLMELGRPVRAERGGEVTAISLAEHRRHEEVAQLVRHHGAAAEACASQTSRGWSNAHPSSSVLISTPPPPTEPMEAPAGHALSHSEEPDLQHRLPRSPSGS